jgi:hypothetical protein
VLVSIVGFFLQSTLPIHVTFGQQLAPVSAATVSSLMMGFAWGVGSLLSPVVYDIDHDDALESSSAEGSRGSQHSIWGG